MSDTPAEMTVGRLVIEYAIDEDGAEVSTTENDGIPVLTAIGLLRIAEANLINGHYNVPGEEEH